MGSVGEKHLMSNEVARLFILVDQNVDEPDSVGRPVTGYQVWEDGESLETDMGEIIIILANRSTCKGRGNEDGYVFSYIGKNHIA
jgi:hypothetical protein